MNKQKKIGLAVLVVILLYAAISVFFQNHYFIETKVNGYSWGFRSESKTKELIKEDIKAYKITIKERNKKKESISFSQVNLAFKDDGKLEGIKAQQKGYAWITALFQSQDYRDAITLTMDDTAFNDTYNNLNAFNKDMDIKPVEIEYGNVGFRNLDTRITEQSGGKGIELRATREVTLVGQGEYSLYKIPATLYFKNEGQKYEEENVAGTNYTIIKGKNEIKTSAKLCLYIDSQEYLIPKAQFKIVEAKDESKSPLRVGVVVNGDKLHILKKLQIFI